MNEMLKKATAEELSELLETMWESSDITRRQAELISEIVDELTCRGELPTVTDNDARLAYEKSRTLITADKNNDNTGDFDWIHSAISIARSTQNAIGLRRKKGSLVAASILVAILLTNTLSSAAIGFNFLSEFFNWTGQAIYSLFGNAPVEDAKLVHLEMLLLKDKLDELGVDVNLPTWLPINFIYRSMEIPFDTEPYTVQTWFFDILSDKEFSLTIDGSGNEYASIKAEANDFSGIGSITHRGRIFSLFLNKSRLAIIWEDNSYQMVIYGDLSYEEAKEIVNSILE